MIASIIGGVFGIFVLLLGAVVSLAGFVFWLWMLIDAVVSEPTTEQKILWFLVVFFLHFIGALVYFLQSATSFWDGVYGVFQAFVWPAYLVWGLLHSLKM